MKGSLEPDQTRRKPRDIGSRMLIRVDRAQCSALPEGQVHRIKTRENPWKDGSYLETYCTACRRTTVRLDAELNDHWRNAPIQMDVTE